MKKLIAVFVVFSYCNITLAQSVDFYGNAVPDDLCSQLGFTNQEAAQTCLNNICGAAGIDNKFVMVPCVDIENCYAIFKHNTAYIVYDNQFLNRIRRFGFTEKNLPNSTINWQEITIMAHEIGHHYLKHLTDRTIQNRYTMPELELQADRFAGMIMYKLKATLAQAKSVMYSSSVSENASQTHPGRADRLKAIEEGYDSASRGGVIRVQSSVEDVINNISLRVRVDNNDKYTYSNGAQTAYHYYITGNDFYLDQISEVRYVRNHNTFYEFANNLYQSSSDRASNFDYKGYQWGYVQTTYITIVLKDGTISNKYLYNITYDQ